MYTTPSVHLPNLTAIDPPSNMTHNRTRRQQLDTGEGIKRCRFMPFKKAEISAMPLAVRQQSRSAVAVAGVRVYGRSPLELRLRFRGKTT